MNAIGDASNLQASAIAYVWNGHQTIHSWYV